MTTGLTATSKQLLHEEKPAGTTQAAELEMIEEEVAGGVTVDETVVLETLAGGESGNPGLTTCTGRTRLG